MIFVLKAAAMVMLIVGFSLAGKRVASVQERKTALLREIILMINVVESRLRHSRLPVADLLCVLDENKGLSGLGFIKTCREKVCFGKDFPDAWRESIDTETEICGILSDSAEYLLSFGADIGSTDLESQLSGCRYYSEIFGRELEIQQEKSRKYSKVFPTLGALLGISAAILII